MLKSIATVGLDKGHVNGTVSGSTSKLNLASPPQLMSDTTVFYFHCLEGTSAAEYQLLRLWGKGDRLSGLNYGSSYRTVEFRVKISQINVNLPNIGKEEIVPRTLVAAGLLSSFVWFYWFLTKPIGYSSVTKNGVTHVVAGSSPVVIFLSVLGILLFAVLMTREVNVETFQPASLRRRCVAFLFDCWFLLLTVTGMSSLLHLLFEAQRSGVFRWRYELETGKGADGADTALILVNLTVMFMYFVLPLARRRQTVGQWLFRLATVSAGGSVLRLPFSTALWRTLMAFRGLISPWRFLKETDSQRRTWYDRKTGFNVVRY